jgi:hypothetical protein
MLWAYLTNSIIINKSNLIQDPLTLECIVCNNDINDLAKGYCELIINGFFSSFSETYDTIFISTYSPSELPLYKNKNFEIKFNEIKAKEYITILENQKNN